MADTTMVKAHEHDTIHSHAKANEETKETSKCVAFDQSVRVILIPSRSEYRKVGLYNALWWNSFEFGQFQASAQNEIRAVAVAEGIGARAARRSCTSPLLEMTGSGADQRDTLTWMFKL